MPVRQCLAQPQTPLLMRHVWRRFTRHPHRAEPTWMLRWPAALSWRRGARTRKSLLAPAARRAPHPRSRRGLRTRGRQPSLPATTLRQQLEARVLSGARRPAAPARMKRRKPRPWRSPGSARPAARAARHAGRSPVRRPERKRRPAGRRRPRPRCRPTSQRRPLVQLLRKPQPAARAELQGPRLALWQPLHPERELRGVRGRPPSQRLLSGSHSPRAWKCFWGAGEIARARATSSASTGSAVPAALLGLSDQMVEYG
mmetsp:Transcript_55696/g.178704  ORF Transcript_55696/g.178704 Transcript_55696/m.178704 type:complete len:257 (-) Transcript_55696:500-1270(-)